MKGWKKIFQLNVSKKQASVAILISDKTDSKSKLIKRDKGQHYIFIKGKSTKRVLQSIHLCTKHKGTKAHKRNTTTDKITYYPHSDSR